MESPWKAQQSPVPWTREGVGLGLVCPGMLLPWMVTVAVVAEMEGNSHSCGRDREQGPEGTGGFDFS